MMTASILVEASTSSNATTTSKPSSDSVVVMNGSNRGLYHPTTVSMSTQQQQQTTYDEEEADNHDPLNNNNHITKSHVIINMKRRNIDPPGRTSDPNDESSSDVADGDSDGDGDDDDDMSYDWSSISSVNDDDDCYMTECPTQQQKHEEEEEEIELPSAPPRRKVTFGMMEVYEVVSLKDYTMEDGTSFHYTSMDMISTRKAGRLAAMTDPNVKNYLYYFEFLYRKIQNYDDNSNSNSNNSSSGSNYELSALDRRILAYGLRNGYQGIEREGKFEQIRQKERHSIVKAIVEAYHAMKEQQPVPISNESNNNTTNTTIGVYDHDAELLRTLAASLTNKMSDWAATMGDAAHLAVME